MRVAIALPTGALLLGCVVGVCFPEISHVDLFPLLITVVAVATLGFVKANHRIFIAGLGLSFMAGGMLLAIHQWQEKWRPSLKIAFESIAHDERHDAIAAGRFVPEEDSAGVVIVGILKSDAASTNSGGVSLDVDCQWIGRMRSGDVGIDPAANPVTGGVLLTVVGTLAADRQSEWRAGRAIRVPAQIHLPAVYLDPGVPDQQRVLARRGVVLVGTVKSGALVELESRGSVVSETAAAVRAFARSAIAASVGRWGSRAAGIVTAIVIGDRSGLDVDVERRLQEAGTYHVIAISGGNIAILAGLTLAAFRIAGLLGRAAMLSAMTGLVAYGYLVGGGASVDRATLMAVVYFVGRALDLRAPPLNTLIVVAGLLLAADPLSVVDPAFLLTFGATASILIVSADIKVGHLPRFVSSLVSMLLASMAAEVALLPVSATIFSRVTFAGLALNFLAIPLMAVAQVAGMVVVPLFAVSRLFASLIGWLAFFGAEGLVRTADLVRFVPFVTWRVAAPALLLSVAYYASASVAWFLWRRRRLWTGSGESFVASALRRGAVVMTVMAGVWIVAEPWTLFRWDGDGRLHVTFIDVGQGDAAAVQFPHGATLLVDAGGLPGSGSFDIGDRVVAPVLRTAGVRRLDVVALTHADADHIGGAESVVREFRPWEIWEGVPVPRSEALQRIRTAAESVHSAWRNVQMSDVNVVDDVKVVVRHPAPPDWERQDSRNDDSVVLELLWRDVSIVLTGDVGADVERSLAPQFQRVPMRVLKVAHHGSLSSSALEFVRALSPGVAVISVGRSNRFGHPAAAVLGRLESIGAEVFRTDRDGAVTVDTDGIHVTVTTFKGRQFRSMRALPGSFMSSCLRGEAFGRCV